MNGRVAKEIRKSLGIKHPSEEVRESRYAYRMAKDYYVANPSRRKEFLRQLKESH